MYMFSSATYFFIRYEKDVSLKMALTSVSAGRCDAYASHPFRV